MKNNNEHSAKPKLNFQINLEDVDQLRSSADDVFMNRLDITWMKGLAPDNNDYSRVLSKLPVEYTEDDGEITYIYNSSGFRSEEFTSQHENKLHVLFSGCSETEGFGANDGEFWASILHKSFREDTTSGFFNLARGGWGWEKIITNSIIYFEKYGIPDYMFIMLPNIYRHSQYFEKTGGWFQIQRHIDDDQRLNFIMNEDVKEHIRENPLSRSKYLTEFIRFISGWKLYLKYCEALGIKVVWSSWYDDDSKNISKMYKFDNFVWLDSEELHKEAAKIAALKKINKTFKKNDLERRDGHKGTIVHQLWASKFLQKAKDCGWEIV
jgi:hypothetical protein